MCIEKSGELSKTKDVKDAKKLPTDNAKKPIGRNTAKSREIAKKIQIVTEDKDPADSASVSSYEQDAPVYSPKSKSDGKQNAKMSSKKEPEDDFRETCDWGEVFSCFNPVKPKSKKPAALSADDQKVDRRLAFANLSTDADKKSTARSTENFPKLDSLDGGDSGNNHGHLSGRVNDLESQVKSLTNQIKAQEIKISTLINSKARPGEKSSNNPNPFAKLHTKFISLCHICAKKN